MDDNIPDKIAYQSNAAFRVSNITISSRDKMDVNVESLKDLISRNAVTSDKQGF